MGTAKKKRAGNLCSIKDGPKSKPH